MRVLLVVPWDEEVGGVAYVAGNLARHLQRQGHDVIFLYPGTAIRLKPKVMKSGFPGFDLRMQSPLGERNPIVSVLAFLILFPITIYQLIRLIQRQRIQIINIHYPMDCAFYLAVCRRMLSVVLINSIHGADIFPDGTRRTKYSRAFRLLLSTSDLIVAPSQRFQNDFLSVFPELTGKTTFIYNGVNLAELNTACAPSGGDNKTPYVLCISTYKEQKAIDVLIRAFKSVLNINPLLTLVLVGGGPLRGQMEELAGSLGVRDRIEFVGPKGRTEVAKLLHGCQVFVLPSRFETFGIVILEAMACMKPVVATTAGGIPEIIENGKNGMLVEPDNPNALAQALVALLENQALQRKLSRHGYDTVRNRFCFERTGASYETAFSSLLRLSVN